MNSTSSTILAKRTLRVRQSSFSGALNSTSSTILVQRCVELDEFGNPLSTNSTSSAILAVPWLHEAEGPKCYRARKKETTSSASALRELSKYQKLPCKIIQAIFQFLAKFSAHKRSAKSSIKFGRILADVCQFWLMLANFDANFYDFV